MQISITLDRWFHLGVSTGPGEHAGPFGHVISGATGAVRSAGGHVGVRSPGLQDR